MHLLQQFDYKVANQWREGNQATDSLVGLEAKGLLKRFNNWRALPRLARGLLRLDAMGMTYLKK